MNVLAIETVTDACSVALGTADATLGRHRVAPREHTTLVFELLDELLTEAGLDRRDIEAVVYDHGPGSFTGVRIGATVAQGIALPRHLPVVGVSSLAALATACQRAGHIGRVLAAWDARRGEIYTANFRVSAHQVERLSADSLVTPEALLLPGGSDWMAVGNARSVFEHQLPDAVLALRWQHDIYPNAVDVLTLGRDALAAGVSIPVHDAVPVYLRGAVD